MNCPVCKDVDLVMADRSGVEIDYCPKCRGVWLDRGELDKIIERSANQFSSPPPQPRNDYQQSSQPPRDSRDYNRDYERDRRDRDYDKRYYDDRNYKHKKRGGFLSEIFDFD